MMTRPLHIAVMITAATLALTSPGMAQATTMSGTTDRSTNDSASVDSILRRNTQALLDAIAVGDTAVWNRLLDPAMIQVDENDVVRRKAAVLESLKPLPPGLKGSLTLAGFTMALHGDVAVTTHDDDEYLSYYGQILLSKFRMTDTWVRNGDGWRLLGTQVLADQKDPPSVHLGRSTLCSYNGTYALTRDIVATIQCTGDSLAMKRKGRANRYFHPEVRDVFFERGEPRTRRIFQRDSTGRVTGFVDRREERDITWKRN